MVNYYDKNYFQYFLRREMKERLVGRREPVKKVKESLVTRLVMSLYVYYSISSGLA